MFQVELQTNLWETSLNGQPIEFLNLHDIMLRCNVDWYTAKFMKQEYSRVIRAMQKGAKLFRGWEQNGDIVYLSTTKKFISKGVVELINDMFDLKWQVVEKADGN